MRISDWSSDVCSSDLGPHRPAGALSLHKKAPPGFLPTGRLIGLRRPPTWSPSSAGGGWGGASETDERPPIPFARQPAPWPASAASSSNAPMLVILIIGLTAGPAVSARKSVG